MRKLLVLVMILASSVGWSQNCNITYDGQILDQGSGLPRCYASIKIIESGKGMITDSLGRFQFKDICPGKYHIEITHVGFQPERLFVDLQKSETQTLSLNRHDELLDEIVVHGESSESMTQVSNVMAQEKILFEANNNLADVVSVISGVSVVKNGPGVSKPVIHGLYGNRVTILNNGVKQAGQRWGNDHAPEIDMFVADHMAVIKGVAGLEISGGSLGGVLSVDPGPIANDPHLHGDINYIFQSNGLGHTLNTKIQKGNAVNQWRLVGTAKLIGDSKTPDYYLSNTGRRESNFAGEWNHFFSDSWKLNTFYSYFHTEIGILPASHVSTLRDLEAAYNAEIPRGTKDHFSYAQKSPRQAVDHHLVKLKSEHMISESEEFSLQYAGQMNLRDEFDVRRGGRSDIPAMSVKLFSQNFDAIYAKEVHSNLSFRTGLQYNYLDNTNDNSTTGYLPLIPDYVSHIPGAFFTLQRDYGRNIVELGARYDFVNQKVKNIERGRTIKDYRVVTYNNVAHNYSLAFGLNTDWSSQLSSRFNLGFAQRTPEVNELYSNGFHQGVGRWEQGDPNLKLEKSIKAVIGTDYTIGKKGFFQAVAYAQYFNDYIFLRYEGDTVTIRGAFPLWLYDQTNAMIYGLDLNFSYSILHQLKFNLGYAYLRGEDLTQKTPLVFMPPNNINSRLQYALNDLGILNNNSITIEGKYVFEQDYEPNQDIKPPPAGYFLLSVGARTTILKGNSAFNIGFKIENLLNTTYRDYLNQMRYFADEPGINAVLTLNYKF